MTEPENNEKFFSKIIEEDAKKREKEEKEREERLIKTIESLKGEHVIPIESLNGI